MIASTMDGFQKSGKVLIALGAALVALGFCCLFLYGNTGVRDFSLGDFSLIDAWGVLWAAGLFFVILGAVAFCTSAAPKAIVRFAGTATLIIFLAFIALAILTPNASVHGPAMPVIIALVAFGAIALFVLLTGLIRLATGRGKPLQ